MSAFDPHARQMEVARQKIAELTRERETYGRLVVCLANALKRGGSIPDVGGFVGVPRAEFDSSAALYTVRIAPVRVRPEPEDDTPEAMDAAEQAAEDMVVVVVEEREGENGRVLRMPRPGIVTP